MDRYATPYRAACLSAGLELADAIPDPEKGAGNAAWTGEAWRALCLVGWGGGDVEAVALELARRLRRSQADARSSARKARDLAEAPPLPADAFERLRAGMPVAPRRGRTRPPKRPEPPPEPVSRPPGVTALLRCCVPAAESPEARAWLKSRGLPERIPNAPFYVLPRDLVDVPEWAQSWQRSGHRALFPLVDYAGHVRSVKARPLGSGKGKAPAGFPVGKLVLANRAALAVLRGDAGDTPPETIVVEGEPDWLTFAASFADLPVIGAASGAWSEAFAQRFPREIGWWIGTDDNEAGDRYAREIAATLRAPAAVMRARVRRLCAVRGAELHGDAPDWNDALQARIFRTGPESMADALIDASVRFAEDSPHD